MERFKARRVVGPSRDFSAGTTALLQWSAVAAAESPAQSAEP